MSELDKTGQSGGEIVDLGEPEEILKILECPVCQEIPYPPITTCSTGHPICQQCRSKCQDCPLCRQPFSQSRNFVMESLVLNARHSCPNKSLGCQVILSGDQMQAHRINCSYTSISCQFGKRDNCGHSKIHFTQYLDHLKIIHGVVERSGSNWMEEYKIRGNVTEPQWAYTYKEIEGQIFFSRVFTIDSHIHWSIAILDGHENAQNFSAIVTIESMKLTETSPQSREKLKMEWTIPIHSIKWSNDQVRQNGHCAVCPLNFMDHFMSTMSNLTEPEQKFQTHFQVFKIT